MSPDFEGRRAVNLKSDGNRHKVTVAKKDLKWYSIVYLDMK